MKFVIVCMLLSFLEADVRGKRPCNICGQLRRAGDKTPDGKVHRVLGKSNQLWWPYADDPSILEQFEQKQKERTLASWRRANETKRLSKKHAQVK